MPDARTYAGQRLADNADAAAFAGSAAPVPAPAVKAAGGPTVYVMHCTKCLSECHVSAYEPRTIGMFNRDMDVSIIMFEHKNHGLGPCPHKQSITVGILDMVSITREFVRHTVDEYGDHYMLNTYFDNGSISGGGLLKEEIPPGMPILEAGEGGE